MRNKIADFIIKTLIVIGIVLLLLLVPGSVVLSFFLDAQVLETLINVVMISFFSTGGMLVLLLPTFGIIMPETKAEKQTIQFGNFNTFYFSLEKALHKHNYLKKEELFINNGTDKVLLYTKKELFQNLKCVAIIQTEQLTEENWQELYLLMKNNARKMPERGVINDAVCIITMICVEHITESFKNLVNKNVQQEFKYYKLPVGVCFEDKCFYIADQKDGFAIAQHRKLKREFKRIIKDL